MHVLGLYRYSFKWIFSEHLKKMPSPQKVKFHLPTNRLSGFFLFRFRVLWFLMMWMQCSAGFQEATPSNHHPSYLIHYYILSFKIETGHVSGQIIATSHNLTPNGGFSKGNPRLFQGKLGEGEIYTSWPDVCQTCRWFGLWIREVHTLPSADVVIVDPPRKFGVPGMDVPGKVLGSKFRISGSFHPKKILSHLEAQDLFRWTSCVNNPSWQSNGKNSVV